MSNELDPIQCVNLMHILSDNSHQLSAGCAGCAEMQCSCSSEVGTAIGVIILAECLVVMVITIIVVLCLWR